MKVGDSVKTPDGRTGRVVSREPLEDPEAGVLHSVDLVVVEFDDGDREGFWHTDLVPTPTAQAAQEIEEGKP